MNKRTHWPFVEYNAAFNAIADVKRTTANFKWNWSNHVSRIYPWSDATREVGARRRSLSARGRKVRMGPAKKALTGLRWKIKTPVFIFHPSFNGGFSDLYFKKSIIMMTLNIINRETSRAILQILSISNR